MVTINLEVMHHVLVDLRKNKIINGEKSFAMTHDSIRTEHELFEVHDEEPEDGADIVILLPNTHERVYVTRYLLMRKTREDLTKLN